MLNLCHTTVRSISGATNERLKQELEGTDLTGYDNIFIQSSTNNNCAPAAYRRTVVGLVNTVKAKAPDATLTISCVCPRDDTDRHRNKVSAYNREVHSVAQQFSLQCVDVESTFTQDDGTINTELFHPDRLHLSRRGRSALLKVINETVPILRTRSDNKGSGNNSYHTQSVQGQTARMRSKQVVCYNCGVPGHVKKDCRKQLNHHSILSTEMVTK